MIAKSIAIKVRGGRSDGCMAKAVGLISGGLRSVLDSGLNVSQGWLIAVQELAAGIVRRRTNGEERLSKPEFSTWESGGKRIASLTAEAEVPGGHPNSSGYGQLVQSSLIDERPLLHQLSRD
ncbi:hypothetical protein BPMI_03313 [Candidatus Burkholderia pumila]|uniref:Uncharacterized protein n=1 Tax=Candidatus Burkholderia pumila TaxID=1090375 RepID=A0ABR5HNS9_9BURK|nr:hypothetical protein BPMI_03313 [Candidatus Burkholderia pumila]